MKNKLFVIVLVLLCLCMVVSITACKETQTYSITFDLNGGTGVSPSIDAIEGGKTVTIPESSITKDGYEFLGWSYGEKLLKAGDTFVMPEDNVTLIASWNKQADIPQPTVYKVSFDLNGGNGELSPIENVKEGDTVTIPEASVLRDEFDFVGWTYGDKLLKAGDTFTMPKGDVALVASWEKMVAVYKVFFDINGGNGNAPVIADQQEGASFTIPDSSLDREYHTFGGWRYGQDAYKAGDSFTMPAKDVEFKAIWNQLDPSFSLESFIYDRLGAGPLELPINLQGANLYIVEINDEAIPNIYVSFDEEKKCVVLAEDYILSLNLGSYAIKAITDGDGEAATCQLTIENSVITSFDKETFKSIDIGKENGVTFTVNYNGTSIVSLKSGDDIVDSDYYEIGENSLTIKADYLKRLIGTVDFTLSLSNHDNYNFSVVNNVIFYTDYDVTTIHDTYLSTIGHNSLYQYVSEESIAILDGPEGMNGKVLRFIPSMESNSLDVHGVYTLKNDRSPYDCWYNVHYSTDRYYIISFDYMTENSVADGDFSFIVGGGNRYTLLSGENNDGIVHHFEVVVDGSTIINGTMIQAKILGTTFYFDNFTVVEVEDVPSISIISDCKVGYDYTIGFDSKGYAYNALLDGQLIDVNVDVEAKTMTIPVSSLEDLSAGKHTIAIKTPLITINAYFDVVDDRESTLASSSVEYSYEEHQSVKIYGSFDKTIEILSLKQVDKFSDDGYSGGWSFAHNNTEKDYKEFAFITAGLNIILFVILMV